MLFNQRQRRKLPCVSDALRQSKMSQEKEGFLQRSLAVSLVLSCGAGLLTLASYLQTAASAARSWKCNLKLQSDASEY